MLLLQQLALVALPPLACGRRRRRGGGGELRLPQGKRGTGTWRHVVLGDDGVFNAPDAACGNASCTWSVDVEGSARGLGPQGSTRYSQLRCVLRKGQLHDRGCVMATRLRHMGRHCVAFHQGSSNDSMT